MIIGYCLFKTELFSVNLSDMMQSRIPGLLKFGAQILYLLLLLLVGLRLIGWLKNMLSKSFCRMEMELGLRKFLISLATVCMYTFLALIIAEKLGFNAASIVAVIGSAGVATALSLQESLSNFAGGIVILVCKPFLVGDYIITPSLEGTVQDIGLIYTHLLTFDNKMSVIPNGGLANSSITNVTAENQRRLDIPIDISYDSDLKKAKEIIFELIDTHASVLHEEKRLPEVFVTALGNNAITLSARVWTATSDYWTTKFDLLEQIKITFDREGIVIPYQQMNVYIKENPAQSKTDRRKHK